MAIMIPSIPNECDERSREEEIFYSLRDHLPDEYYVFHSFRFIEIDNNEWEEKETDFVIFHKHKGILCLEAKAGAVSFDGERWHYGNHSEMRDPFAQANSAKWKLEKCIGSFPEGKKLLQDCKMLAAVWFPSLDICRKNKLVLPQNTAPELILTGSDLEDPLPGIERIFNIGTHITRKDFDTGELVRIPVSGELSREDSLFIRQHILCPSFNILPSKTEELDYKKERFNALIKEQYNLLNYLEDQRTAVINGAAGTGKTMIAVEKARRNAAEGSFVLFLCFNIRLKEYLEKTYAYPGVDYYTIDKFACHLCNTKEADFDLLIYRLMEMREEHTFPYRHIIIDEAQDFGQNRIIQAGDLCSCFEDIVLSEETGSFYVFYDKMQTVQSFKLPPFIDEADCKLTLYKNCRNTRRIAETSFKPLKKTPKLFDSAINGSLPEIFFVEDKLQTQKLLDKVISESFARGITNLQVLTCAAEGRSTLEPYLDEHGDYEYKNKKIPFTTCRKFKGLEADKIIIVDVTRNMLSEDNKVFYVGTSRARLELCILADISAEDATAIVGDMGSFVKKNAPCATLAKLLGCKPGE